MATPTQVKIDMATRAFKYLESASDALKSVLQNEQLLIEANQRLMYAQILITKFISKNKPQKPEPVVDPGENYPVGN